MKSVIILLLGLMLGINGKYVVKLVRVNRQKPLCSSQDGNSFFKFNYNPSFADLRKDRKKVSEGLFVLSKNMTPKAGLGPSVITLTRSKDLFADTDNIVLEKITAESVIFESSGSAENYTIEDPRVVYREKDNKYYLFYSAVEKTKEKVVSRLSLATSYTPSIKDSWKRHGSIIKDFEWSKSGALILRDVEGGPHYLIWGSHDLRIAISTDLIKYQSLPKIFLSPRENHFDSLLVESGPDPHKLSDGNYFFIYNSARFASPEKDTIQYNAGFLILDGKNPTRILQRSEVPILSPELGWEKGDSPYLCLAPNTIFIGACKPLGHDKFLIFYGGAGAVVGSAIISVTSEI